MTKEEATTLLEEYNKGEFHLKHAHIVGDVMRYFAQKLGYGDEADFWEIVGLLHDLDFEMYPGSIVLKVRRLCAKEDLTKGLSGRRQVTATA